MNRLCLLTVLALALAGGAIAQCDPLVFAPQSDPSIGTCNAIPFGQSTGYTYMSVIPSTSLDSLNTYFNDIAIAPCGTGSFTATTAIIAVGHLPNPVPAPFNFPIFDSAGVLQSIGDFQDLMIAHNSFVTGTQGPTSQSGPFAIMATQDAWSPFGFAANQGTGFTWNGVDAVGVFISFEAPTRVGWTGSAHRDTFLRFYTNSFGATTSATSASAAAVNLRVSVTRGPGVPGAINWQCNQADSSVVVNGAADPGPIAPMTTRIGEGSTVNVDLGGFLGGGFDIPFTIPEGGVPVSNGGFLTPTQTQAFNVNLFAPSFSFAFGGSFLTPFAPVTLPISSSIPVNISLQQIVISPTQLDGFALSHLNEIEWVTCGVNESFENNATGLGQAPVGWSNPFMGQQAWTIQTGGTSSAATGPTSAFDGLNYAYCETSGFTNTTFSFSTCGADAATLIQGRLEFQLSAIGATTGTLNVYQGDGSGNFNPTPIFTQTGPEAGQAQGGVEWTLKSVPLAPLVSNRVDFLFEYISGTSFTGDLAVDAIQVL